MAQYARAIAPYRAPSRRSRSPPRLDALCVRSLQVPPRHLQVVVGLQAHPELRAVAEVQAQPQRGVGGDAASVVDDLGDTIGRDADVFCELVLRQAMLGQELLLQHLAGSDRSKLV